MPGRISGIGAYLKRWKNEYDFRTLANSLGSALATAAFALYNGYLGLAHGSGWHKGISVYYLMLALLRGAIILSERFPRRGDAPQPAKKHLLPIAVLLLLTNLCLVAPFALMVRQEKPVSMTLIPAIAMAAYTTFKVSLAAVNLKRRNRSDDPRVRLLRSLSFADALVSIITLQNTLIMVNTRGDKLTMLPLTAITSGVIWLAIVWVTARSVLHEFRVARNGSLSVQQRGR